MKILHRIKTYIVRNFSAQVILINVIAMSLIVGLLQVYMQMAYLPTLTRQLEEQKSSILKQESTIIETQLDYFLQIGSGLAANDDLYVQAEATAAESVYDAEHLALTNMLTHLASYSDDIVELAVIHDGRILGQFDKSHYATTYGIWNSATQNIAFEMAAEVIERSNNRVVPKYVWATTPDRYGVNNRNVIHLAVPIIGDRHSYNGFSNILIATFRLNGLQEFLGSSDASSGYDGIYITNEEGEIAYAYYRQMTGEDSEDYYASDDMDILTQELGASGLSLNIAVNTRMLGEPISKLFMTGFRMYIVLLAALAVGYYFLTIRMLRPIQVIREAMRQIEEGAPAQTIHVQGQYEIEQLADQYNQMVETLQEQVTLTAQENQEKLVQMERATRAEKEALESQINAHFLCNTLNAIHYDAMERGEVQISILLRKLSNILRYSFSRQYENVSIAQEMAWVEQYLYLQQFRLMDVFDYVIETPAEYEEWPCVKLSLQPFVENSILHGFEGMEQGGMIRITGTVTEGCYVITISDNGCGMAPARAAEIRQILDNTETAETRAVHGVGIRNVCARLRMFYGENFRITLETAEGAGTTYVMHLPIPPDMMGGDES